MDLFREELHEVVQKSLQVFVHLRLLARHRLTEIIAFQQFMVGLIERMALFDHVFGENAHSLTPERDLLPLSFLRFRPVAAQLDVLAAFVQFPPLERCLAFFDVYFVILVIARTWIHVAELEAPIHYCLPISVGICVEESLYFFFWQIWVPRDTLRRSSLGSRSHLARLLLHLHRRCLDRGRHVRLLQDALELELLA